MINNDERDYEEEAANRRLLEEGDGDQVDVVATNRDFGYPDGQFHAFDRHKSYGQRAVDTAAAGLVGIDPQTPEFAAAQRATGIGMTPEAEAQAAQELRRKQENERLIQNTRTAQRRGAVAAIILACPGWAIINVVEDKESTAIMFDTGNGDRAFITIDICEGPR